MASLSSPISGLARLVSLTSMLAVIVFLIEFDDQRTFPYLLGERATGALDLVYFYCGLFVGAPIVVAAWIIWLRIRQLRSCRQKFHQSRMARYRTVALQF